MHLTKGGNAPLDQARLMLVLTWKGQHDVDISALLVDANGRVRSDNDFIFYNQPRHFSAAVTHLGKSVGSDSRDSIGVELEKVEHSVERIVISASAGGLRFGDLTGLELQVLDATSHQPVLTYPITDATVETAMIAGELYRRNGQWKFRAIGQGYDSGLKGVATDYGITVEEDELVHDAVEPPAPAPPAPAVTAAPTFHLPPSPPVSSEVRTYAPPPPAVATFQASANEESEEDAEVTLRPFQTDNPYLKKLFTMKEFGRAPGRATQIYSQRVIDPQEKMLAAFKSQHGRMRWGYLILTTEYLRWFQTLPLQNEEMFEYTDRIEQEGSLIRLPNGDQFQLKGFGAGRKFKAIFQVAQQGSLWVPR